MPAGVSWPTYLRFTVAAGLSMVAGAQTVHFVYRPLDDLEDWIANFQEQKKVYEESKTGNKVNTTEPLKGNSK